MLIRESRGLLKYIRTVKGTNNWPTYSSSTDAIKQTISNVNLKTLYSYSRMLEKMNDHGVLPFNIPFSDCVSHSSIALSLSGAANIFSIHPYMLAFQMAMRDYYLYNILSYNLQW